LNFYHQTAENKLTGIFPSSIGRLSEISIIDLSEYL